jgi:solute carrier family 25 (mitochondrial phosphate transporter), member 23/24/25/41
MTEWYHLMNGGARVTSFPINYVPPTLFHLHQSSPPNLNTRIIHSPNLNRDFLLFLPDAQNLEAVLSYYNSTTVSISPEGDVHVSNEASTGLGTFFMFLKPLFASIILVAHSPPQSSTLKFPPLRSPFVPVSSSSEAGDDESLDFSQFADTMSGIPRLSAVPKVTAAEIAVLPATDWSRWENLRPVLIACVPSTGYFAAGAVAGIASRTATAPIDRLKVYLIAQTKKPDISLQAFKAGSIFNVFGAAFRTTSYALKDLWAAGGLRSLYAGKYLDII